MFVNHMYVFRCVVVPQAVPQVCQAVCLVCIDASLLRFPTTYSCHMVGQRTHQQSRVDRVSLFIKPVVSHSVGVCHVLCPFRCNSTSVVVICSTCNINNIASKGMIGHGQHVVDVVIA